MPKRTQFYSYRNGFCSIRFAFVAWFVRYRIIEEYLGLPLVTVATVSTCGAASLSLSLPFPSFFLF
jgi:hypothetical protein